MTETQRVTRILLVDDHSIVRGGLALLVAQQPGMEVCGEAGTYSEALEVIAREKPDLAVVDIALAGADGLELIKQVKAQYSDMLVLALSMHNESLYAERALKAGAMGYLTKGDAAEEFTRAIQRIVGGEVYLSDEFTGIMLRRMAGGGNGASPEERLTDRELSVLRLMGEGCSTREAAEMLNLSIKTVQTHQEHIKRKLAIESGNELVRYAILWKERESGG